MKICLHTIGLAASLMLVGQSLSAYDAKIGGICYNFLGDEAAVTYEGYTTNQYSERICESDYRGDIVIPASVQYKDKTYTVTSIGDSAFSNCEKLKTIALPNSLTVIGRSAFSFCDSLTCIAVPGSVKTIGEDASFVKISPECTLYMPAAGIETYMLADGWAAIGKFSTIEALWAIDQIADEGASADTYIDLQGRKYAHPRSCVNIVRNGSGATRKVLLP